MDFKEKYLKYKKKYINLKQKGGSNVNNRIDVDLANETQPTNNDILVTPTDQGTTPTNAIPVRPPPQSTITIPPGSINLPFPNIQNTIPQTPTGQTTTPSNDMPVRPPPQSITIPDGSIGPPFPIIEDAPRTPTDQRTTPRNATPVRTSLPNQNLFSATPERQVRQPEAPSLRDSRNEARSNFYNQSLIDNEPIILREDFNRLMEEASSPENRRSMHNGREIDDDMWDWVTNNVEIPRNLQDPISLTIYDRPRPISTGFNLSQFVLNRIGRICPFTRQRFTVGEPNNQILTDIDNWWTNAIREYDNRDIPASTPKKIKLGN